MRRAAKRAQRALRPVAKTGFREQASSRLLSEHRAKRHAVQHTARAVAVEGITRRLRDYLRTEGVETQRQSKFRR